MHAQNVIDKLESRLSEKNWTGLTRDEAKKLLSHAKGLEHALAEMLRLMYETRKVVKSA